ncbi:MAG TPA: hypothetical protein VH020_01105 [Stellaceae bacterium]|nr:hypothetical protein [Stellaceae bacterium]
MRRLLTGFLSAGLLVTASAYAADAAGPPAGSAALLAKMPAAFRAPGARHYCGQYPNNGEAFAISITGGATPQADYVSATYVATPGPVETGGNMVTWKSWDPHGVTFHYAFDPPAAGHPSHFKEEVTGANNAVYETDQVQSAP